MNTNIITATDSYKIGHHLMYPKNTEAVYSYWEARDGAKYSETIMYGLQAILKRYLMGCRVKQIDIDEAKFLVKCHLGDEKMFNEPMWDEILRVHHGRLPIRIRAVPEGMPVPPDNVLLTIENTGGPLTAPLTNHLETLLSQLWYPSTVCTVSREIKKVCKEYLLRTSDNQDHLKFMLHDFGYRGVSSVESAGAGGSAHLVNFYGTDTIRAMEWAEEYYYADIANLAWSVPASEHSVMTALGRVGEEGVLLNLLEAFPKGILSVVIDSYNYGDFIDGFARKHKDKILGRDGKFVFRPDSGDPVGVTIDCLRRLEDVFGAVLTSKGKKKLNPKVGLLWGDGIDYSDVVDILDTMEADGWAAENIVFGMGGGLLQKCNRDVQRFAFKSSAQKRGGIWCDVKKDPIEGSKASKAGRLALIRAIGSHGSGYKTIKEEDAGGKDLLETVFENGSFVKTTTFDNIRARAELP
jgi:nicotinamide phosphoribosyltransferase